MNLKPAAGQNTGGAICDKNLAKGGLPFSIFLQKFAPMFSGHPVLQSCVSKWKAARSFSAPALFRSGAGRLAGMAAKVRAAFSFKVPVGYEDATGFNYGATPVPPAKKTCRPAFVFMFIGGLLATAPAQAFASPSLTLAWNASSSPSVAGYNIYYGTQAGSYTNKISVGNVTNATVSGLSAGVRTYFVVTARDSLGLESLPSNAVSYTVPGLFALAIQMIQGNPASVTITSTGTTPTNWVLESSSDLAAWVTAAQGTNTPVSVSMLVTGTPAMFFRLRD